MTALEGAPGRRKALVTVTTLQLPHGEETVAGRPRWLGSVRWADVYDGLYDATPAEPAVAMTWRPRPQC
jgi:hypothetical protein